MPTAFVTGGSGFLGRNLIPYLGEHGWEVRALGRSRSAQEAVRASGAEPVAGDLSGGPAVVDGMRGCDAVFHAAAWADDWGDPKEAWEANVVGTERMLEAALAAGVPRFVHVSTEAVLVDGSPLVNVDETRPLPTKPIGLYPITKGAAEARARAASRPGFDVIVVRPRFIWGRGDTSVLPRLVEGAKDGSFRWIGGGLHLTSTCHVRNVCEGMLKAATHGTAGAVYFLTDGAPVQLREMLSAMLRSQGIEPPDGTIPRWLAHASAVVTDFLWRTLKLSGRPPLPHATFHLIGDEVTVNDARARRELGYVGEMTRDEGLRDMRVAQSQAT